MEARRARRGMDSWGWGTGQSIWPALKGGHMATTWNWLHERTFSRSIAARHSFSLSFIVALAIQASF